MHVHKRFDYVSQILNGLSDVEIVHFIEVVEKSPSVHILECKIDVFLVLEAAIKPDDVGML